MKKKNLKSGLPSEFAKFESAMKKIVAAPKLEIDKEINLKKPSKKKKN